jgi:hypothetical protein
MSAAKWQNIAGSKKFFKFYSNFGSVGILLAILPKDHVTYMWVISKTKICKDAIGIECNKKKKFCVLQKKVLSFVPNCTLEVRLNSLAEPNVRLVTTTSISV